MFSRNNNKYYTSLNSDIFSELEKAWNLLQNLNLTNDCSELWVEDIILKRTITELKSLQNVRGYFSKNINKHSLQDLHFYVF